MLEKTVEFELVAGFTASNLQSSRALITDLLNFESLTTVVVCDNSDDSVALNKTLDLLTAKGVVVRFVTKMEVEGLSRSGTFGEYYADVRRQKGIAFGRTALHYFLYFEARQLKNPVVWILDDDVRINELHLRSSVRPSMFVGLVKQLKAENVDIAVGRIAGDPPLPIESMIRTQLLDLDFNLKALCNSELSIDSSAVRFQNQNNATKYPDYYYDLTLSHNGHLETPWWFATNSKDRLAALEEMLQRVQGIQSGVNVFRPLSQGNSLVSTETQTTPTRGGNTLVLNIDCLKDYPNLSPQVENLAFRRGDTAWVVLNKRFGKCKVVLTDFSVRQDRRFSTKSEFHVETLLSDILGSALTRALDAVLTAYDQNDEQVFELSSQDVSKVVSISEDYVRKRLSQVRLNSWRIQGLIASIRNQIDNVMRNGGPEATIIGKYLDSIDSLLQLVEVTFSPATSNDIEQGAISVVHSEELKSFIENLLNLCSSYHDAVIEREIFLEAASYLETHFGKRNFELLARGKEGLIFSDGVFAYKYFYDGTKNFTDNQLEFVLSKLSRESGGNIRYITLIERAIVDDNHVVFVSNLARGKEYSGGLLDSFRGLMKECKKMGVVLTNISPENIVATADSFSFVDIGRSVESYTERGYREMCKRAYLVYKWHFRKDLKELLHVALHDESIPELFGFEHFLASLEEKDIHEVIDDSLISMICNEKPRRVLDYGCGSGFVADKLAEKGMSVVAYDIDSSRYSTHTHAGNVSFLDRSGMLSLLESHATFDLVLCNLVLCTVSNQKEVLHILFEIRKLVGESGKVVIGLCNPFDIDNGESEANVKQIPKGYKYSDHFEYSKTVKTSRRRRVDHHRPLSWYSMMLRRTGFEIQELFEVPSTDIPRLSSGSEVLLMKLNPIPVPQQSNVSLLIKASAMEWRTIREQVTHIVKQLECPALFLEKIVVIDNYVGSFARQYDSSNLDSVKRDLALLVDHGIIDRVAVAPDDDETKRILNRKWFGIDSPASRCRNGQPTITTLFGLDQCKGEYILHVDSDCLIGRVDRQHDYLADLVKVFEKDDKALSVSLSIAQKTRSEFTPRNDGTGTKWRIEVRCGMLSRLRLQEILPLSNSITSEGFLETPWHRAIDLKLSELPYQSYRGGDFSTFFIHVPNYRKKNFDDWYNIMKSVEEGLLNGEQLGNVDLVGSAKDWLPKRSENCILIVRGRNVPFSKLRRCFDSLYRQSDQDWGMIVVDAGSENGMYEYIEMVIRQRYGPRLTFYRNLVPNFSVANIDFAIRNLCREEQSIILMPDADDAFIRSDAIDYVQSLYSEGADLVIGGLLRTDKEVKYPANFDNPRLNRGGNVWQPLRSFRKYLFDKIDVSDLKVDGEWVPHTEDWAFMLPIAEMALCPVHLKEKIYLYEPSSLKQTLAKEERENLIAKIVAKPAYSWSVSQNA